MVRQVRSLVGQRLSVPAGLRGHCYCDVDLETEGTEVAKAERYTRGAPGRTAEGYLMFCLTCPYCGRGVYFRTDIRITG